MKVLNRVGKLAGMRAEMKDVRKVGGWVEMTVPTKAD